MPHSSRPPTRQARPRGASRAVRAVVLLGVLAASLPLGSCAYYNTFYIARKYYGRATLGLPYRVDPTATTDLSNLNKSIDYSKKLMANYPRSKWVDDAYLLWARAFLAKNDPLQTVTMLQDFATRYPDSPLKNDAVFYRAVALRQARRYTEALAEFDAFLAAAPPKNELLPYAHLERSRTLRSLDRHADAAAAAGVVVDRWPKSALAVTARTARAEAALAQGDYELARQDFHAMGERARTDDERLNFLLRESEGLEAARRYPEALTLLRSALAHERPPQRPDTTGGRPLVIPQTPGYDRHGRLLTRIGTVQLMSGDVQGALASFRRVVDDYPRTPVSAEAQYRIGYALEIGADDFERARTEYAKVRDQNPSSPFVAQATQRQNTLDQLARFRAAGSDSLERRAQGGFLLAEQYLFQLDKPDRALVEYAKVSSENVGSPWAGKALNAQAWVLRNKLQKPAEAESLYWKVVREYPATEAQLAARDYLEGMGRTVPAHLIKLPAPDTTAARAAAELRRPLTPAPTGPMPLGMPPGALNDSLQRAMMSRAVFSGPGAGRGGLANPRLNADSLAAVPRDTLGASFQAPGTVPSFPGGPGLAVVVDTTGGRPVTQPEPDPDTAAVVRPPFGGTPPHRPVAAAPDSATARLARTLAGSALADTARRAVPTDTIGAPLPPLEFSPVRPGITFPSGAPRALGLPGSSGLSPSESDRIRSGVLTRESPVIGAPRAPAAADSVRVRAAAADSVRRLREPRPFEPRGGKFQ